MADLWLHIGTPKTGSTAIQLFGRDHAAFLAERGVRFVPMGRRASFNKLAKAMRQNDEAATAAWAQVGERGVREAAEDARHVVASSEMLSTNGVDLERLRHAMPSLDQMPLHIVIYVRRQDKYLESFFKQRVKTGRYMHSLQEYITSRRDQYGDYERIVSRWQAGFPEARIHLRRFETPRLEQGNVIADFLALLGVTDLPEGALAEQPANEAPSLELLNLLQLLKRAGPYDIDRLRPILQTALPVAKGATRLMSAAEAQSVLAYYDSCNEALRARFFPDDATLFDMSDLEGQGATDPPEPVFTSEQRAMIRTLLNAISKVHLKGRAA